MTGSERGSNSAAHVAQWILPLDKVGLLDRSLVGPKSLNLARLRNIIRADASESRTPPEQQSRTEVYVPDGFVITTEGIQHLLADPDWLAALAVFEEPAGPDADQTALGRVLDHVAVTPELPVELSAALVDELERISRSDDGNNPAVAVRSSAVSEDSAAVSYSGVFDSVLNVVDLAEFRSALLRVLLSTRRARALSYRRQMGISPTALEPDTMAVLVQRMVRSVAAGGVVISSDAASEGTSPPDSIIIEAIPGPASGVVDGSIDPFSYLVDPSTGVVELAGPGGVAVETGPIDDGTAILLSEWASRLAAELGNQVLVEWSWEAPDGADSPDGGRLALLQVSPHHRAWSSRRGTTDLAGTTDGRVLTQGLAIGSGSVYGDAVVLDDPFNLPQDLPERFVLVVAETSPDWVPVMEQATALITDHGGRGSHAAIVCRELGIRAVLGCGNATTVLLDSANEQGSPTYGAPTRRVTPRVLVVCEAGGRGVVREVSTG